MGLKLTSQGLEDAAPGGQAAVLADLRRAFSRDASLWALLLAATGLAGGAVLGVDHALATAMLGLWAVAVLAGRLGLSAHLPHTQLGMANRITLGRLALGMPLGGLAVLLCLQLLDRSQVGSGVAWVLVVLATLAALLDIADGYWARRSGVSSEFGARFDMETDAWLILVLAVLVWQLGQAPVWVLAAGALRYGFVAAAWLWPWMNRALPPSGRRKTVCVVQIVALIVCLGPVVSPALATALAAATLALLVLSFAVDIAWLWRHRRVSQA